MVLKQPALGCAILWGDGTVSSDGIFVAGTQIWNYGARVHTTGVRSTTGAKWYPNFVNPSSMTDSAESILAYGEAGVVRGLTVGPTGAWFYPPR
jgi:hypothetical protein